MKVLFITRKWPPAVGGMETYAYELTQELGYAVVLTINALPGRTDGSVPSIAAMVGFAFRVVASILSSGKHDVIHGADMAIWPLALLGRLRSPRAAVVLSAHGTDVSFGERSGPGPALYRLYVRVGARLSRRAIVLSNSSATAARVTALGFKAVRTVPLGTRVLGAPAPPDEPGRFVLFTGRLLRRKGCAWFATEVLPLLAPDISLKVAGTIWDQAERAMLASDRISYLGPLDQNRLGRLMAEALCVVIPNIPTEPGHFEGFGLVAVEAAAAGGVVVASRMDGFTDSVIDELTGFLVEPGSAAAWTAKIAEIAAWSAAERRAFIEGASAKARDYFSWERTAQDTLDIYRTAVR